MKQWFESWFDTPYYHILYQNRNEAEAQLFIQNLHSHFKFSHKHHILDLACGKGRHSVYLHSLGTTVTGVDLSANSIQTAKQSEKEGLQFQVHDMRAPYRENEFDFVLNLFTSFGYFDTQQEHENTIQSVYASLKSKGIFILDYLNVEKVLNILPIKEEKVEGGIPFFIHKYVHNQYITKDITFAQNGDSYSYTEKVKTFRVNDFRKMFEKAGFSFHVLAGNYNLEEFEPTQSDRLIMYGVKP